MRLDREKAEVSYLPRSGAEQQANADLPAKRKHCNRGQSMGCIIWRVDGTAQLDQSFNLFLNVINTLFRTEVTCQLKPNPCKDKALIE